MKTAKFDFCSGNYFFSVEFDVDRDGILAGWFGDRQMKQEVLECWVLALGESLIVDRAWGNDCSWGADENRA